MPSSPSPTSPPSSALPPSGPSATDPPAPAGPPRRPASPPCAPSTFAATTSTHAEPRSGSGRSTTTCRSNPSSRRSSSSSFATSGPEGRTRRAVVPNSRQSADQRPPLRHPLRPRRTCIDLDTRTPFSGHLVRNIATTNVGRVGGHPVAQAVTGHTPPTVTGRYLHVTVAEVARASPPSRVNRTPCRDRDPVDPGVAAKPSRDADLPGELPTTLLSPDQAGRWHRHGRLGATAMGGDYKRNRLRRRNENADTRSHRPIR